MYKMECLKLREREKNVEADFAAIVRGLIYNCGVPKERILQIVEAASMSEQELDKEIERKTREIFEILGKVIKHE